MFFTVLDAILFNSGDRTFISNCTYKVTPLSSCKFRKIDTRSLDHKWPETSERSLVGMMQMIDGDMITLARNLQVAPSLWQKLGITS